MTKNNHTKRRIALQPEGAGNRIAADADYKQECELIDLSSYKSLQFDNTNNNEHVVCGAKVTMHELVSFTFARGKIPKVVAEFKNITVGGAISGCSLESTSHTHGQFMDTVAWVRVRKGDGSIVTTKKGDDLWCAISGTYGTIGIVLDAAVECIDASPFVEVSYYLMSNTSELTKNLAIKHQSDDKQYLFLEGLQFPEEQVVGSAAVMIQGKFVNGQQQHTNHRHQSCCWREKVHGGSFYFEHVRSICNNVLLSKREERQQQLIYIETIPTVDYLFRYDYGAFWMAIPMTFQLREVLSYLPFIIGLFFASFRWIRLVTGSMFTTKHLFKILKSAPQNLIASKMVVQDFYIPSDNASEFISWVRGNTTLSTPIWVCPVKSNSDQKFTPSYNNNNKNIGLFLNCGIYGRVPDAKGNQYTQKLEKVCSKLGGRKMLYAQSHYKHTIFWNIYDKQFYDKTRLQEKATESFPDLYEKTCTEIPPLTHSWTEALISLFF